MSCFEEAGVFPRLLREKDVLGISLSLRYTAVCVYKTVAHFACTVGVQVYCTRSVEVYCTRTAAMSRYCTRTCTRTVRCSCTRRKYFRNYNVVLSYFRTSVQYEYSTLGILYAYTTEVLPEVLPYRRRYTYWK